MQIMIFFAYQRYVGSSVCQDKLQMSRECCISSWAYSSPSWRPCRGWWPHSGQNTPYQTNTNQTKNPIILDKIVSVCSVRQCELQNKGTGYCFVQCHEIPQYKIFANLCKFAKIIVQRCAYFPPIHSCDSLWSQTALRYHSIPARSYIRTAQSQSMHCPGQRRDTEQRCFLICSVSRDFFHFQCA